MLVLFDCYLAGVGKMKNTESRSDGARGAPRRREFGEADGDDGDSGNMSLFAILGPPKVVSDLTDTMSTLSPAAPAPPDRKQGPDPSPDDVERWDVDPKSDASGGLDLLPPAEVVGDLTDTMSTLSTATPTPPDRKQGPDPSPDDVERWDVDPKSDDSDDLDLLPPPKVVSDPTDTMSTLSTATPTPPDRKQGPDPSPDDVERWDTEPASASAPEADSLSVPDEPDAVQVPPNITAGAPPVEVAQDADMPDTARRETARERRRRQGKQLLAVYVEQSSNLVENTWRYIIRLGTGRTWSRYESPGDVAVLVSQVRAAFENETAAAIKYGRSSDRKTTLRRYLVFELRFAALLYDSATDAKRAELLAQYSASDELRAWRTYVKDEWLADFRRSGRHSDRLIKFLLAIGL